MKRIENYIEEARKHEVVFRLILDKLTGWKLSNNHKNIPNDFLTIDELYKSYSTEHRIGKFIVLSFKEVGPNLFEFGWEDVRPLSGGGSVDLYTLNIDGITCVKNIERWRS